MNVLDLPEDIHRVILSVLRPPDQLQLISTCKTLYSVHYHRVFVALVEHLPPDVLLYICSPRSKLLGTELTPEFRSRTAGIRRYVLLHRRAPSFRFLKCATGIWFITG